MIEGVVLKELKTSADERGFFREIIRITDDFFAEGFGQWAHSKMYRDVVKAWHIHQTQIDWWYVPMGALKVALHDLRANSPTHGQNQDMFLGEQYGDKDMMITTGVADE